jgi:hypothetical protein
MKSIKAIRASWLERQAQFGPITPHEYSQRQMQQSKERDMSIAQQLDSMRKTLQQVLQRIDDGNKKGALQGAVDGLGKAFDHFVGSDKKPNA